jgi:hypothetical protein
MNLIETTTDPVKPDSEIIAAKMSHHVNAVLAQRVFDHQSGFRLFWESSETPDAILAALGVNAQLVLAAAGENVNHLTRLAAFAGKQLSDFLSDSEWIPPREFVPGLNGTMTLTPPAEGFDAWGNAIPTPEPE